jgi:hypothetical protein
MKRRNAKDSSRTHTPNSLERENVEVNLPIYVGDLLVFPRGGLKYAGKSGHGNETRHKKDLDGFYNSEVSLTEYTDSSSLHLSGLGYILRDASQTIENPLITAKAKIDNRREVSALKRSSTLPISNDVNGWDFLSRVSKNKGEKTSLSLFKLAKLIEGSKDEDIAKIVKNALPKDTIPFLLAGFFQNNGNLDSISKEQYNSTATAFYKQALKAELFLLAWQMKTLEGDNKSLGGKNVDLLAVNAGSGKRDMIAAIDNKRYTTQKVYDRNLAFPKEAANFQYDAMIRKGGKLNIAERNPATRPSTLRYEGDKGPLSEEQSMDWQPIERRIEEGGGLVDLVRKHGSGKSEFAERIEHKLSNSDSGSLKLDELIRVILELNEADVKDEMTSPAIAQYSPMTGNNTPNLISPAVEKRRVSGVGIEKIKNDTRLFKINLHSSSDDVERITSFINLQEDILQYGPRTMLHRLKNVDGIDDILGSDNKEKLKNLKLISKAKLVVLADEFYYFNDKQIREADDKTVREIEEIKYDLIDKWCKSGSVVVTLGASASLGKIGVECEELDKTIKKEQESLNSSGNKAVVKKARSFLYSFNGKNLKDNPVLFKVLDDGKSTDQAEDSKKSTNRREKSNINWKGRAEVETSDSKMKMPIKVNKANITNREYLIRSAWCIKELGKFAPPKIKNCKEYSDVISALTPKSFEARNFPNDPKYLWGELSSVDEVIAGKKAKNSRKFSLNEEDLFRAVKVFIGNGLCDSFPSGTNIENSSGSAKTTISELKEELELKKSQYDDLRSRLDDAVGRFKDFSFALEEPKDSSASLFEVVNSQLSKLNAGEKMQYILPQFKINEETCTESDIGNILEKSGANIVIIPHKEIGSNEPKCKIAYLMDGVVNIAVSELSEVNNKLGSISEGFPPEQKVSMLSFYDKDNAIGGDYGIASVGIRYQTIQATDNNFLVGSKSKPAMTFQEIEQNERRNRADLEDINVGDVVSKFVMPSDSEGIDISKCDAGDVIPQEVMDVIALNTIVHDNMIAEVYRQYIGRNIEVEVEESEKAESGVIESVLVIDDNGDDKSRYEDVVPVDLFLDEKMGIVAADSVDLKRLDNADYDIEEEDELEAYSYIEEEDESEAYSDIEEEEFEIDGKYLNITVRSHEVNGKTDMKFPDQDGEKMDGVIGEFSDQDGEEMDGVIGEVSKPTPSYMEANQDLDDICKTPPRLGPRAVSMSSLSKVFGKKMFELFEFELKEDNPLFEEREECKSNCLVCCDGVYEGDWNDIAKTLGRIIIESAHACKLNGNQICEALDICQRQAGIGNAAISSLGESELPEGYKDNEYAYVEFSRRVQDLCKECGIFSPEVDDENQELCGFSVAVMPKGVLSEIEDCIVNTEGDFEEMRKIYNRDLDDKSKRAKIEIYGEEKRSQSVGRGGF